jgi:tRNA pseudouridine38-40 synthase
MNYAAVVEYRGTHFHGWEAQTGEVRTVQAEVERALSQVAHAPVSTVCAGRTDAGVHARGQVVSFHSTAQRQPKNWLLGANSVLADDVSVRKVVTVHDDFHARFSATARVYQYRILNRLARSALLHDRVWWVYRPLDVDAMVRASRCLLGEQDFSAFRSSICQSRTPMRFLSQLDIRRDGEEVVFDVTGNAFLHHMVRNIVGTLVEVGRAKQVESWVQEVLAAKDRKLAGMTAPASGLTLMAVQYPELML